LKESYSETHTQYDNLCKEHRELREKYDTILRDKIPPTSEYQKLVDKNCELKTEANFWREEYGKLLIDFNILKQSSKP
jgi:FtsZ-binding cell division protein ZapB